MLKLCLKQLPQTVMFGCFRQSQNWTHCGNILSRHLLVFGLKGEAVFHYLNTDYLIRRGELLIIPAHTHYTAHTNNGFEYYFIHLEEYALRSVSPQDEVISKFDGCNGFSLPPTVYDGLYLKPWIPLGNQFEHVLLMLTNCQTYMVGITPQKKLLLDLCVLQLLVKISRLCSPTDQNLEYPELLTKMQIWCQQHYTEKITLSGLAAHFYVSKTYTARLFRVHLSTTVTEYIKTLRMQYACDLLRFSTMNIGQIAEASGFCNVYYFSRLFMRKYFVTPTAYRKNSVEHVSEI